MYTHKKQIILGSIVISALIVAGAAFVAHRRSVSSTFKPRATRNVTKAELAKNNGKDGNDCLVAVDGMVYKIAGFALWQNGEHTPSDGQAYCGADMTDAIGKSPHGRSKLNELEKIGPLIN